MKTWLLSIIFSYGGLFLALPVFAETLLCRTVFSSEYALNGRIEVLPQGMKGGLRVSDYAQKVQEIDTMLGDLARPNEFQIKVNDDFAKSQADLYSNIVYVGIQPETMGAKNPQLNLSILSHEYGHAVFHVNLMKDLASYKELREQESRIRNLRKKVVEEAQALGHKSDVTFNKKDQTLLENQIQDKISEFKALSDQKKQVESASGFDPKIHRHR